MSLNFFVRAGTSLPSPGFSLVEVLVALFIFSFGLLGIAALQLNALKSNFNAYLRSMAVSQLENGYDRLEVGNRQRELRLWNEMNKRLLPVGYGVLENNILKVCWFDKSKVKNECIESAYEVG